MSKLLEFETLLMLHKRFELYAFQRLKALSFFSVVFPAGVLLDIQQHFGVKDSGAGLLQTGKSIRFLAGFYNLPLLRRVPSGFFVYGPWTLWLWSTRLLGRWVNMSGFLVLICCWVGDQGSEWLECRMCEKQTSLMILFMTTKFK